MKEQDIYNYYRYFYPPLISNNPINQNEINDNNYKINYIEDLNKRIERLERQTKRLEQRLTRLETPYTNNNYNIEPDNNMYMM